MKCFKCDAKMEKGTTTNVTDLGNCLVIIRNVPCYKCTECDEFFYTGDENSYFTSYVNALVVAGIHVGVVTNHNKFNVQEFKILKKRQGRRMFFCFPA